MGYYMFSPKAAKELLKNKSIYFFGDSNSRALYKDLTWLLEDGRLIPNSSLKSKNEISHANDTRLSNGILHSGRNYEEIRSYSENSHIEFHFITRLFLPGFLQTVKNFKHEPDVLVINSSVWDLTRWGSNGVQQFKENVQNTFRFLKERLQFTQIIWLTTLPPTFNSHGGFLRQELQFLRNMLPWQIMFANKYSSNVAKSFNIDVLDLHYNFRFLSDFHIKDGIHWSPAAVRHATNMLLTHISLSVGHELPLASVKTSNYLTQLNSNDLRTVEERKGKELKRKGRNTLLNNSNKRGKYQYRFNEGPKLSAEPINNNYQVNFNFSQNCSDIQMGRKANVWLDDYNINNFANQNFRSEPLPQGFQTNFSAQNDIFSSYNFLLENIQTTFNPPNCTFNGNFCSNTNLNSQYWLYRRM